MISRGAMEPSCNAPHRVTKLGKRNGSNVYAVDEDVSCDEVLIDPSEEGKQSGRFPGASSTNEEEIIRRAKRLSTQRWHLPTTDSKFQSTL